MTQRLTRVSWGKGFQKCWRPERCLIPRTIPERYLFCNLGRRVSSERGVRLSGPDLTREISKWAFPTTEPVHRGFQGGGKIEKYSDASATQASDLDGEAHWDGWKGAGGMGAGL